VSIAADGSTLPFPTAPSASTAGYTLAESTHQRRVEPRHLPDDAPNILIVPLDDVGFGLSDVVGGEVRTPAFRRVAETGICYNTFHTTSICSPTRAALLTERNHHRVHSGTIAERAVDWDGYTGVIGKDTADVAEALQVNADEWREELSLIEEWFEFIGEKLPTGVKDEFDALKQRLAESS
jgi:Sulfatase